ncbi:IS110 family transposase [Pseudonocardia sp. KRD291]|uniref:IS110 family transposase n=1 Tax=Pseudonocardia sp. KRD291 TaxID=2792007 RepID=UPI001C5C6ED3|nr:IS110 family transposase [Pseudonocardia sp. KRD291]MBW0104304.1 IS110 family transposase [Pseudonocardia sp. KRD291]
MTAGLDWSTTDHAVAVVDHTGTTLDRFTVAADAAGLRELVRRLGQAGVGEVAIERSDGQAVDALLEAGLAVVVISPNQVKNLRSRYGQAGNKDDRFDAFVLADTLRTDRARLRPLLPDSPATVLLRSVVRARKDLLAHRIGLANQLRAHLQLYYSGPVGLFADLDAPTSLRFLTRFTCQDDADWLTPARLGTWLGKVGYTGRKDPAVLHRHLMAAPRGARGPEGAGAAAITLALVRALTGLVKQIQVLEAKIGELLDAHTDAHIFRSLPRAQALRAARLLAEIGDCRARFPTPESLASLAGVTPSTRQSGKVKNTTFRWAADKHLRDAVCDFASDSRHVSPWAADLYRRARARGHHHPHAVRILARAWVYVIWRCWQNHQPYDPGQHRALQQLLDQSATAA